MNGRRWQTLFAAHCQLFVRYGYGGSLRRKSQPPGIHLHMELDGRRTRLEVLHARDEGQVDGAEWHPRDSEVPRGLPRSERQLPIERDVGGRQLRRVPDRADLALSLRGSTRRRYEDVSPDDPERGRLR